MQRRLKAFLRSLLLAATTLLADSSAFVLPLNKHFGYSKNLADLFAAPLFELDEETWSKNLSKLEEFKEKHGDCLVPEAWEEDPSFGDWVSRQRQLLKEAKESPNDVKSEYAYMLDRIDRLDAIGFEWDPFDAMWEENFRKLEEYKATYGDCLVPEEWSEDPSLGFWVRRQRGYLKGTKDSPGDAKLGDVYRLDRIDRLDAIGFEWDPLGAMWEDNFRKLQEYKETHRDCLVPQEWTEDPSLGKWVMHQRQLLKELKEESPDSVDSRRLVANVDRFHRLDAIGFEWDANAAAWDKCYKRLEEYQRVEGDCLVPQIYGLDPKLGAWVSRQRTALKEIHFDLNNVHPDYQHKLERVRRLNEIGFIWNVRDWKAAKALEMRERLW